MGEKEGRASGDWKTLMREGIGPWIREVPDGQKWLGKEASVLTRKLGKPIRWPTGDRKLTVAGQCPHRRGVARPAS